MKTTRDFSWLNRAFPVGTPPPINVADVAEVLLPTFDALGTARLAPGPDFWFQSQGGATVLNNNLNVVPKGKVWYIPYASCKHDSAVSTHLFLELVSPDTVPLVTTLAYSGAAVSANFILAQTRTIIVPPGWFFRARVAALGAGEHLTLSALVWEVDAGETIAFPS